MALGPQKVTAPERRSPRPRGTGVVGQPLHSPPLIVLGPGAGPWHLLGWRSAHNQNGCLPRGGLWKDRPPCRDLLEAPSPQTVQSPPLHCRAGPPPSAALVSPLQTSCGSSPPAPRGAWCGRWGHPASRSSSHPGPHLPWVSRAGASAPFLHTHPCLTRSFHKFHQGWPRQHPW